MFVEYSNSVINGFIAKGCDNFPNFFSGVQYVLYDRWRKLTPTGKYYSLLPTRWCCYGLFKSGFGLSESAGCKPTPAWHTENLDPWQEEHVDSAQPAKPSLRFEYNYIREESLDTNISSIPKYHLLYSYTTFSNLPPSPPSVFHHNHQKYFTQSSGIPTQPSLVFQQNCL
jgi:hypothetical protein